MLTQMLSAVQNCESLGSKVTDDLQTWFNYSIQFLRIHVSDASYLCYEACLESVFEVALMNYNWKNQKSFIVSLIFSLEEWVSEKNQRSLLLFRIFAATYPSISEEDREAYFEFFFKLKELDYLTFSSPLKEQEGRLIIDLIHSYISKLTSPQCFQCNRMCKQMKLWIQSNPILLHELKPLFEWSIENQSLVLFCSLCLTVDELNAATPARHFRRARSHQRGMHLLFELALANVLPHQPFPNLHQFDSSRSQFQIARSQLARCFAGRFPRLVANLRSLRVCKALDSMPASSQRRNNRRAQARRCSRISEPFPGRNRIDLQGKRSTQCGSRSLRKRDADSIAMPLLWIGRNVIGSFQLSERGCERI